jgi:hypothetical protein
MDRTHRCSNLFHAANLRLGNFMGYLLGSWDY